MGILGAAGVVFFAFIGFDAVSTAAQEAKNPKRDMPIGILGSLVVCTDPLRAVRARAERRRDGRGLPHRPAREASVAFAISKYMTGYEWLSQVRDGRDPGRVLVGHPGDAARAVARVLLDEPRRPRAEGVLRHCTRATRRRTSRTCCSSSSPRPSPRSCPEDIVGEMTSIGTLFAFILVCAGVWIMRVRRPDLERGFTVPALPFVSALGHRRLRRDDLRAGLDQLAAPRRLAGASVSCSTSATAGDIASSGRCSAAPTAAIGAAGSPPVAVVGRAGACRWCSLVIVLTLRHRRLHRDRGVERVRRVLHDGHHRHHGRVRGDPSRCRAPAGCSTSASVSSASRRSSTRFRSCLPRLVEGGPARTPAVRRRQERMLDEHQGSLHRLRIRPYRHIIAQEFARQSVPFVLVERDPERMQEAIEDGLPGRPGGREPARTC